MLVKNKLGRELEITVYGKYDDDIQIDDAVYLDNDEEVSDEDIEYITKHYADEIYQEWIENKSSEAYDRYKDFQKYGE